MNKIIIFSFTLIIATTAVFIGINHTSTFSIPLNDSLYIHQYACIQATAISIVNYSESYNKYPSDLYELEKDSIRKICWHDNIKDAFENMLIYKTENRSVIIQSLGMDEKLEGEGLDSDITCILTPVDDTLLKFKVEITGITEEAKKVLSKYNKSSFINKKYIYPTVPSAKNDIIIRKLKKYEAQKK